MAARKSPSAFRMSDEHRVKIANSNILNALIEHVEGVREMSATQVTAGIALLRKVMPDLTASENSTELTLAIERIEYVVVEQAQEQPRLINGNGHNAPH